MSECLFEAWNVFIYALTFAPDASCGCRRGAGLVVFLALQQRLVGSLSAGAIQ